MCCRKAQDHPGRRKGRYSEAVAYPNLLVTCPFVCAKVSLKEINDLTVIGHTIATFTNSMSLVGKSHIGNLEAIVTHFLDDAVR